MNVEQMYSLLDSVCSTLILRVLRRKTAAMCDRKQSIATLDECKRSFVALNRRFAR